MPILRFNVQYLCNILTVFCISISPRFAEAYSDVESRKPFPGSYNGRMRDTGKIAGATTSQEDRRGIAAGVFCYALWGLLPIYWKLLGEVSPFEVVAHRVIWCFATTFLICLVLRLGLKDLLKQPRAWRFLAPAAIIVTLNWSIYIYGVSIDHIVETAIGYYINPLVSILLGLVLFRERLSPLRWAAVALCVVGVTYFTVDYGQFPWIAILLALTFGVYGAIKKQGAYPAVPAIAFENVVMVIPAIIFAIVLAQTTGTHAFAANLDTAHGWYLTVLLVVAGPLTALPLILFAHAANSIPLSLLGFIQYISPTLSLITGVFIYGEPFTFAHAVCFGCIWAGLALVSIDAIASHGKQG